jgi:hypothetical protein
LLRVTGTLRHGPRIGLEAITEAVRETRG